MISAHIARGRLLRLLIVAVSVCLFEGCSAFHPVRGVPASYLPHDLRPEKRSGKRTIDLSLLRQTPPPVYRLDAGDTLGLYIEGVLGRPEDVPPVFFPEDNAAPPSLGYPMPIREDGTISLPLVGTVPVRGLTIREVEEKLRYEYTVRKQILKPNRERIFVSLQRPRVHQVLVIRQEEGNDLAGGGAGGLNLGALKRGTGQLVSLPAYKNDVLHALAQTNGLPGLDAENAVYIIRGGNVGGGLPPMHAPMLPTHGHTPVASLPPGIGGHAPVMMPPQYGGHAFGGPPTIDNQRVIKIPIRLGPGEQTTFTEQDIILRDGDVVFIESRDTEVFYTGGLLGGGQYTLPRDYDLDILEAISIAQGNNAGGGGNANTVTGTVSALNNDVSVSASTAVVIRKMPNGTTFPIKVNLYKARQRPQERLIIQPGDYVLLQYTPLEAVGAFLERNLLEGALFGIATGFLELDGNGN